MDALWADTDGLARLAGECQILASGLSNVPAPPSTGPAGQASTAAVSAVHTVVGATGAALIGRLQSTSARFAAAGTAYTDRDADAASLLHTAREALEA